MKYTSLYINWWVNNYLSYYTEKEIQISNTLHVLNLILFIIIILCCLTYSICFYTLLSVMSLIYLIDTLSSDQQSCLHHYHHIPSLVWPQDTSCGFYITICSFEVKVIKIHMHPLRGHHDSGCFHWDVLIILLSILKYNILP